MISERSRIDALQKRLRDVEVELSTVTPWLHDPTKQQILSALKTSDRTSVAPFRVVYVDINGNDNAGDGSILNPFASVQKGVDVANAISPFNVFVALGPGTYLENNPLVLPNNTYIIGWDNNRWVVSPQNLTSDVFQISATNTDVVFIGGAILGLGTTGAGINQTGIGTTVACEQIIMRDVATGFKISNGSMLCNNTELSELDSIVTGYDVSNGAVMSVGANSIRDNATVTTVFTADGSGTLLNIGGPTSVKSTNITTFINADNGAAVELLTGVIDGPTTGVTTDNGSSIECIGAVFRNTTTDIEVIDTASSVNFVGASLDKNKIIFPVGFMNTSMLFQDNTEDEEATKIYGDLFVGRPEDGTVLFTGQGEPSTRGMVVLTTDNTATSTTDGGNLTDVTTAASSFSGSTFSFQGVTANHTILVATELENGGDLLKYPGIFSIQTTAAAEVTPRSFILEYWDGAAWEEITVLAVQEENSYRYGNEVFIRANSREHIRFNDDIMDLWTKKTINGVNAFWSRIRIETTVTTAPVFEQFRLHANSGEFAEDGYARFYGKSRNRTTLLAFGNIWGESGGVLDASIPIGTGGIPTGWNHDVKNGQMNGAGDAIYLNMTIPRGICTGCSLKIRVVYQPDQTGASTDASFIVSVLPIEIEGTSEADPTGGVTPVPRTLANTEVVTANSAQTTTVSVPIATETKLQSFESGPVDISNYYEGDMVAIRIEMDSDGSAGKDVFIWAVEMSAVQWTLGERLL